MRKLHIWKSITVRTPSFNAYLADISKDDMISPEEEVELGQRIKRGDRKALDKLVRANLFFVISVANQYGSRGVAKDDLINAGNEGLIKAAKKFDDTLGFKFISYAVRRIRQAILQELAMQGTVIRYPANVLARKQAIGRIQWRFMQENGRLPLSAEELADLTWYPVDTVEETLQLRKQVSLDCPLSPDDEDKSNTLLEVLSDEDAPSPCGAHDLKTEIRGLVERLEKQAEDELSSRQQRRMAPLSDKVVLQKKRDLQIFKSRFGIGCPEKTVLELSLDHGIDAVRVQQIIDRYLTMLRRHPNIGRFKQYL